MEIESKKNFYRLKKPTTNIFKFKDICSLLGVYHNKPGWPDHFGRHFNKHFHSLNLKKIKTLSLFTGAGGLDIGFHDCGFDILEMVEIDPRFTKSLEENTGQGHYLGKSKPSCIDIRDYNPPNDLKVDFILGGPPCQTFSSAGRRASGVLGTTDQRGYLFKEYIRLLKQLKPKAFLFENVYGITGAQNGEAWKEIKESFKSAGYHINYRVLDAADFGVPQHRERLFIIGTKRKTNFKFPKPTHGPDSVDKCDYYTSGLAIKNTTLLNGIDQEEVGGRYGHLLLQIPPGLNYSFLTEKMGHPHPMFAWRSKFSDFLYKSDPERPVRTIKAQGGKFTGPFHWGNRPFSIQELKRLQTFPDCYDIIGGKSIIIHQIGNSVPPQIARVLAISILDQIFQYDMGFSLPLLEENEELNFRTRKRELTTLYRKKAKEAISNLVKNKTAIIKKKTYSAYAELDEKFNLYISKKDKKELFYKFCNSIDKYQWDLKFFNSENKKAKSIMDIKIMWKEGKKKPLGIRYRVSSIEDGQLTAGFKVIENKLNQFGIKEDFVQLLGYYQYKMEANIKVTFHNELKTNKFAYILKSVLEGEVTRKTKEYKYFAEKWGCNIKDVIKIAIELKKMGFEVRNSGTNPQILEKHLLIPYEVPTLTSKSVQLNKKLKMRSSHGKN